VARSGVLVSEVRAQKPMGSNHFVLVDAGFNDLMRPAMYGSEHRISVLSSQGEKRLGALCETVVAGPLCESGDIFTQAPGGDVEPVPLPRTEVGDLMVFHDTGAYGASMSSNYNSRPLIPEVLTENGQLRLIRRRQTMRDLLALESI
jgi:diaminopimelate decarboxylase